MLRRASETIRQLRVFMNHIEGACEGLVENGEAMLRELRKYPREWGVVTVQGFYTERPKIEPPNFPEPVEKQITLGAVFDFSEKLVEFSYGHDRMRVGERTLHTPVRLERLVVTTSANMALSEVQIGQLSLLANVGAVQRVEAAHVFEPSQLLILRGFPLKAFT